MPGQYLTRLDIPPVGGFRLLTAGHDEIVGGIIRGSRLWEPVETALLLGFVRPGDRVVDVGAHVGYFTVLASKRVGRSGQVLAFEPESGNFELLKANCILNGCHNVGLERKALLDRRGRGCLWLSQHNTGDHRLAPVEGRVGQVADVVRLDDWWRNRGPIDFLKLDVQGCEIPALQGMTEAIRESAAGLAGLVEISPQLSERAGYGPEALLGLLTRLDARAYDFALHDEGLRLEHLDEAALGALWRKLLRAERDDAGHNLLLFFAETARERFLRRLPPDLKAIIEALCAAAGQDCRIAAERQDRR